MSSNKIENKQNNANVEFSQKESLENKNQLKKNKEKESILSESSNENESNNNNDQIFDKNKNDKNNERNKEDYIPNEIEKDDANINSPNNTINKNRINYNNYDNNFFNNENEENISKSMSSHQSSLSRSNKSRSRSRSHSNNNSFQRNMEQNYDNFNDREIRNSKKYGNKFENLNNNRRGRKNMEDINNSNNFIMKNGCCRDCMKAFSKNGKSCLCQVPRKERKYHLPENGCNYCGCKGCNPIDVRYIERMAQKNILFKDKGINHKNQRILDSDDENLKIKEDDVDYYNMEKKEIQEDLNDVLKINSIFYGFGVPLRSPSYILGYNPNINYFYEKRINNNYFDNNININNNINNNMTDNMNNNINNNMNNNMNNINNNLGNNMNYDFNNTDKNYNNNNNFRRNYYNNGNMNKNRNMKFNKNQRYRK